MLLNKSHQQNHIMNETKTNSLFIQTNLIACDEVSRKEFLKERKEHSYRDSKEDRFSIKGEESTTIYVTRRNSRGKISKSFKVLFGGKTPTFQYDLFCAAEQAAAL